MWDFFEFSNMVLSECWRVWPSEIFDLYQEYVWFSKMFELDKWLESNKE